MRTQPITIPQRSIPPQADLREMLRGCPDLPISDPALAALPEEELRCRPNTAVNMRSLAVQEADQIRCQWDCSIEAVRHAAAEIAGVIGSPAQPQIEVGAPFQVWMHDWRAVMLRPEDGVEQRLGGAAADRRGLMACR
ncbi:MAG: hypothetical protein M1434_00695 [Chloroflexi bacterium]|nr:hypothetical protein [Chloroflexota bacterium]MCL5273250.1 hypothetical protein [Chloroflexota bacterium]